MTISQRTLDERKPRPSSAHTCVIAGARKTGEGVKEVDGDSQLIIDQNKPPTYSPWLSGLQEKTTNCESSLEIQAPCNLQHRDFDKTYSEGARPYSSKRNLIIRLIMYLESLGVFQLLVRNIRHW